VPNAAVVRVTRDNLGLTMRALPGKHVVFYIPEQPIQGFDYQKIFRDYDVVRITDIAYELESEATGVVPYGGSTLFWSTTLDMRMVLFHVACRGTR